MSEPLTPDADPPNPSRPVAPAKPASVVPEPATAEAFAVFMRQLRQRRVTGAAVAAAIVDRLAAMTSDELRKVPSSIIGRLGPEGLASMVERSAALQAAAAGLPANVEQRPAEAAARRPERPPGFVAGWRKRQPLPWQAAVSFATALLVVIVLLTVAPFVWRLVTDISLASAPRLCRQLDRWTGECRYRVGSGALTLKQAAAELGLSLDALAEANPRLRPGVHLAPGTILSVPSRSVLNLR